LDAGFMSKRYVVSLGFVVIAMCFFSFKNVLRSEYSENYYGNLVEFRFRQITLLEVIKNADLSRPAEIAKIRAGINDARIAMKGADLWLRYLDPLAYKKINAPLPVEWETEVFEKFEKPYKREGAGLTLAALYLDEAKIEKDSLLYLIRSSLSATDIFTADSTTADLNAYHHFYLCNRLFLLNLAAIYTTSFECPDPERIIPEIRTLLISASHTYTSFNKSFPETQLPSEYLRLFNDLLAFVDTQPDDHIQFDHYTFIKSYVNPLFVINQSLIQQYHVVSHNLIDYSLNKNATSIFDKHLYNGQNSKGVFIRVNEPAVLARIEGIGKKLFYDPILSGNNMRSCASCHKSAQYFTDTVATTALNYNQSNNLSRNTPSLINANYNHLLMLDGKHFNLQNQCRGVITSKDEMNCDEKEMLKKIIGCKEYKRDLQFLLKYTPQQKGITIEHITSAITFYYSKFSDGYSPFDDAMNGKAELSQSARNGFNLFMGKAQCGTCHFVPQFNGVKPPYVSSEFEVLGVPADTSYKDLSSDEGRFAINTAKETRNAFRTGTIRNAAHTKPYMHNGVFNSLEQVIDFYSAGGGAGRGLKIPNQTLSSDSLRLTVQEKSDLISFIHSLDEHIVFETPPGKLPKSKNKSLNNRTIGGAY
jgi:cytochrome c peroxidase